MKIGIIGLKPRQVTDIRSRKLPSDVVFFDGSKSYTASNINTFASKVDRLLVIQQQVPLHALEGVPRAKRHPMAGGVSTILRYIETLRAAGQLGTAANDPAPVTHKVNYQPTSPAPLTESSPAAVEPASPTPDSSVEPADPVAVPTKEKLPPVVCHMAALVSDVPTGHRSQYLLPKTDILINYPNSGGVQDYKILQAATEGDIVRFARPEGLPFKIWRSRITSMRHQYYVKRGVLIEAHFYNEYVDLQVMRKGEPVVNRIAVSTTESKSSTDTGVSMPASTTVRTESEEGVSAAELRSDAVVPTKATTVNVTVDARTMAVDGAQAPTDTPTTGSSTTAERAFWRNVYLASLAHTNDVTLAQTQADAALEHHRLRFSRR